MTKNEIRLQYSGFIIFAAKMLSIATGLAFQLMIARTTTKEEYGVWFNIGDLLAYFVLLAGTFSFWTMRFTARGREGAVKTGILVNLAISVIATIIYIPLVPIITSSLGISQNYVLLYFLVSTQIVELYSINMIEACLRAKKPQTVGYGLLIAETVKVILAYILIIQFQQPLLGAMLSLITAFTIQIAYYFKLIVDELKQKVRWEYVKEWFKGSLANIYSVIGNRIAAFIFIMLFAYGGKEARSDYGAAAQIANIIPYSFFLAFALYPKLLAEKSLKDITTSLKMVLMFAIPMAAGAMVIPDSLLTILQVVYKEATPVLFLLAIDALTATLSQFFTSVLFGVEKLDEKAKIPLKQLAKSNIFKVFTLPYIHAAITLPTAFYALTNFAFNPLEAALYVTIINMTARFAIFLVLYAIVRKSVTIVIPWRNIAKYVFASAVMASILFIIPHQKRLTLTLCVTILGGLIYIASLMAIDKEARTLIASIWSEIKKEIKGIQLQFSKSKEENLWKTE